MADGTTLRLPALEVKQGARRIFCFAVDGKRLHEFAAISRIRRDDNDQLRGYQRPEVANHIRAIQRYLESESPIIPNAVVLAFTKDVEFKATDDSNSEAYSRPGELLIPITADMPDDQKPAWLVDGQQRSAAIREADVAEFPIAAVGFIAEDEADQRAQFILVNNTKPLPKGLIHELLPDTTGHLPPAYARRQLPATLMTRLNGSFDGPFYQAIATVTSPAAYIKDNSVLKMLENSLTEGALYQYRDPEGGQGDIAQMIEHLNTYWGLVAKTFPEAWALPPRFSRLTHGVGVQAMGFIMDHLTEDLPAAKVGDAVQDSLKRLASSAAWTSGSWNFGDGETHKWNSLQNTPTDVRLLTKGLLSIIRQGTLFDSLDP